MNLMMLLEMAAQGFGDRVAIQNEGEALTYAELFAAAGGAAREIKDSGAARAAVLDVSSLALPVVLFGSAWAGIPFVPLNYRLTGEEVDRLLEQIKPCYLVATPERVEGLSSHSETTLVPRTDFISSVQGGETPDPEWGMDPEEIAILLFTSGTTGPPKQAVLRHKHIVSYILGSVEFMGAAESDAALVTVPPYHIAGMAAMASSVYSGRRMVQLPNFEAEKWIELARSEKITHAFVVPTMLSRIVDALEGAESAGLPHLRALSYGGGKMPLPVIERAMKLFPDTDFTNAYGLTETSSTLTVLGPDDHRSAAASDDASVRRRLASVGQPLPTVEIEIRDDEGKSLPAGGRGEIHVRGEQVSGEYLGKGTRLLDDGFFPTRDGGWLDAEGYLFLEGRVDDIIVRGGENMSPGEMEDVLLEHEGVSDCCVVGIPSEQWGEAVAAVIVKRAGKEVEIPSLQEFVKSQLRSSRTPETIEFWDELPYNETGKVLRRVVRARLSGDAS
jgi:acyl-CoA synthetase (AMP-forming)/AMP-acid ligase II